MFFWSALMALRTIRKAKAAVEVVVDTNVEEILRNGMGWAWEIGKGQPMAEELTTTVGNPFLNPDWREVMYK